MFLLIALLALFQQPVETGTIEGLVVRAGTTFPISGVQIKARGDAGVMMETATDGSGNFVLRDVPSGRVTLEASAEGYVFPNATLTTTVNLSPGQRLKLPTIPVRRAASIRGRVLDNDGKGIPDIPISFLRSVPVLSIVNVSGERQLIPMMGAVRTDDNGEYRHDMLDPADYFVRAVISRPDAFSLKLYYPSTTDADLAAPIHLDEGAEAIADIRLTDAVEGRTYRISGRVLPLPGKPPASVGILLKTRGGPYGAEADSSSDSAGAFELRGVRPGSYELFASANIDGREYLGKIPIEVRDMDLGDVQLTLQASAEVKGHLVLDSDSSGLQISRARDGNVKISLNRKDGLFGDLLKAVVDDTGTVFSFKDTPPGDYDVAVTFVADRNGPPSSDLYVSDIRASGRSVFDRGLQVGVDPSDALEIVIGTKGGSIAGSINTTSVQRQAYVVILAPEFSRRSNATLFKTALQSTPDGQFQIRGIAPGIYKIFAVPYANQVTDRDREFLAQNESRAVTVVVQQGLSLSGVQVPLLVPAK
jgi:hypothetical protein